MTQAEARGAALRYVASASSWDDDQPVIVDDLTRDLGYGWMFHYNSARYLQSKNFRDALAGNGPIVVLKSTGEVAALTSALPVEDALGEFEQRRGLAQSARQSGPPV